MSTPLPPSPELPETAPTAAAASTFRRLTLLELSPTSPGVLPALVPAPLATGPDSPRRRFGPVTTAGSSDPTSWLRNPERLGGNTTSPSGFARGTGITHIPVAAWTSTASAFSPFCASSRSTTSCPSRSSPSHRPRRTIRTEHRPLRPTPTRPRHQRNNIPPHTPRQSRTLTRRHHHTRTRITLRHQQHRPTPGIRNTTPHELHQPTTSNHIPRHQHPHRIHRHTHRHRRRHTHRHARRALTLTPPPGTTRPQQQRGGLRPPSHRLTPQRVRGRADRRPGLRVPDHRPRLARHRLARPRLGSSLVPGHGLLTSQLRNTGSSSHSRPVPLRVLFLLFLPLLRLRPKLRQLRLLVPSQWPLLLQRLQLHNTGSSSHSRPVPLRFLFVLLPFPLRTRVRLYCLIRRSEYPTPTITRTPPQQQRLRPPSAA